MNDKELGDKLDPAALLEAVEDSPDPIAKLNALERVQQLTNMRLRRLKAVFGSDLSKLHDGEKSVAELERKLQETQRDMTNSSRNKERHTLAHGQASLSDLIAGNDGSYLRYDEKESHSVVVNEEDFEPWQIGPEEQDSQKKTGSKVYPAQSHNVPKLALEKL
jgi:hypothetical protein